MGLGARNKAKCHFSMVLYVDILGPVIEAAGKRCYILAIQGRCSKYALTNIILNWEPDTVLEQILVSWVRDFGFPGSIWSELGRLLEEQVWQALCDRVQVWRPHITYPALALTEKFSHYLKQVIKEC